MRITSKGQVTIPAHIRREARLLPETDVEFVIEDGKVVLRHATGQLAEIRGRIRSLRGAGTANLHMTTDEIMEMMRGPWEDLSDEAVSVQESPEPFRHK